MTSYYISKANFKVKYFDKWSSVNRYFKIIQYSNNHKHCIIDVEIHDPLKI